MIGIPSPSEIEPVDPVDRLRSIEEMTSPDERMSFFALRDASGIRSLTQQDRSLAISACELPLAVPKNVRLHFDTARNLYLYAWFVYRFHVVAEQQALATLELALRLRLREEGLVDFEGALVPRQRPNARSPARKRSPPPAGLYMLFRVAIEHGLVANDRLTRRQVWAEQLAEERAGIEQSRFMSANNLSEMAIDEAPAVPTTLELEHDWLGEFQSTLPGMRNDYAHGSERLHASVLRTFAVVAELASQLYT
jgi:hypothetical protein